MAIKAFRSSILHFNDDAQAEFFDDGILLLDSDTGLVKAVGDAKAMLVKLDGIEIKQLLQEHHEDMLKHSPVESVHALDLSSLKAPDVTFWTAWINGELAGCGALKRLNSTHTELKSMRTAQKFLRKGVAVKLLTHILAPAKAKDYQTVSLETGVKLDFSLLMCY